MADVLVVDDSRDVADSLAELVSLIGHSVRVAYDGHWALSEMAQSLPEVVLLDLNMPRMDGFEVARRVRARYGESIRLIGHSAIPRAEIAHQAADAGFDSFLAKPTLPIPLALAIGGRGRGYALRSATRDRRAGHRPSKHRRKADFYPACQEEQARSKVS